MRPWGGVAIYILNELNFKLCQTQHAFVKSESLWLELAQQNLETKSIVDVIYCHPDQSAINEFFDSSSNCLNKLSYKQIYYLIGDFNIDVKKKNLSNSAKTYINTSTSDGAVSLITKPTRLTDQTSAIIDQTSKQYNYK